MTIVSVCVGSACHLKGSSRIINRIEGLIDENKLHDRITLKAAFCIGECTNAVSVKVDNVVYSVCEENVEAFFRDNVLGRLNDDIY